ncbi:hypothetical protein SODALDRAFT_330705 [Sodiomyces alkalinus F11]|uniref:Uncharacterized protein n=1 Tax=Sodiomyces alkalinus (strain CBS 110278 / VKM F-3762 / F11) TaxID=1314773 RepID=A0A3N2Q2K0_SODAK|nr:hypothetical protein SODALDRAFT_330705 [Sodiomyces alkalinus F11]ROT40983.1 hypothetical protein SODALDRAFT_330705 [Sodiomyces alkalinus F11]
MGTGGNVQGEGVLHRGRKWLNSLENVKPSHRVVSIPGAGKSMIPRRNLAVIFLSTLSWLPYLHTPSLAAWCPHGCWAMT